MPFNSFRRLFACLSFIALTAALTACQNDFLPKKSQKKGSQGQEIQEQVVDTIEQLLTRSDVPVKEIEKLHQFEYTIFRLPLDSSPTRIEAVLNQLGRKRWNCFHIEKTIAYDEVKDTTETPKRMFSFFCKRNPETPLRFVPQTLIGR